MLSNEFVLLIGLALGYIIGNLKGFGININSGNKENWEKEVDSGDEWKNK